jgi:hypothetical protein
MVEPLFPLSELRNTRGTPATWQSRSAGSGKVVTVHFCAVCGTKLYLSFERFPNICGVYAGVFDDPDWVTVNPGNAKQIFVQEARQETILPARMACFAEHALTNDGEPRTPVLFDTPRTARGEQPA